MSKHDFKLSPGATLGTAPDRASKELIAHALREMDIEARYIIIAPGAGFRVETAGWELAGDVHAARALVTGVLLALRPPDALAAGVVTSRNEWARLEGKSGQAIYGITFCCGAPGCIVTASVRRADLGAAWTVLAREGWTQSPVCGYCCPDHAAETERAA